MDKRLVACTLVAILGLGIAAKLIKNKHEFSSKGNSWEMNDGNPTSPINEPVKPLATPVKSYDEALKLGAKLGKPILLVFKTKSCGYCDMMEKNVWNKTEINEPLSHYVFYKINLDIDNEDYHLGQKYNIDGVPSFKIINSKEEVLKSDKGYKDLKRMIEWLNNPNLYKQEIIEPKEIVPEPIPEPQPEPESPKKGFHPFKRK